MYTYICLYICVSGCLAGTWKKEPARGTEWAHTWEQGRMGSKAVAPPAGACAAADNIVWARGGGNNGNFLAWAPAWGRRPVLLQQITPGAGLPSPCLRPWRTHARVSVALRAGVLQTAAGWWASQGFGQFAFNPGQVRNAQNVAPLRIPSHPSGQGHSVTSRLVVCSGVPGSKRRGG